MDISSILCICSEMTWDAQSSAKIIPASDKVMRPRQIEHEAMHQGQMRMFCSNLLRSELALYYVGETLQEAEAIMAPIAGPREKARLECLKAANVMLPISQLDSDERWAGETTNIGAMPGDLFPLFIGDENDATPKNALPSDLQLGDINLIQKETLEEASAASGSGTPSIRVSAGGSRELPAVECNGEATKDNDDANIVVLVEAYTSQDYADGVPQRRQKRRRLMGGTNITPAQAERIGRKKAERRLKREKEFEQQLQRLKEDFTGVVTLTKKITLRHVTCLQASIIHDLVFVTGDNALVKALKDQHIDLEKLGLVVVHPSRSLVGL